MLKYLLQIALASYTLYAKELFWHHDFATTIALAQAEQKPVLMMYSANWCPECSYMKEIVFEEPKVYSFVKKHFKLLLLDVQKDTLPKSFSFKGIPTFFIIDPFTNKEIKKVEGGTKATVFLQKLKSIQN